LEYIFAGLTLINLQDAYKHLRDYIKHL